MKTPTRRSLVFLLGAFVFLLSGTMTLDSHLLGAVDCVGKPYGFPGCPTRSTSSLASSSGGVNTCGNAIVEDAEQCDKGRFNGKTDCSTDCKNLYCGDGVLSKDLGEECEPETQEFYVEDKNGNLTTEIRFVGATQFVSTYPEASPRGVLFPGKGLSTDNAVMIALAGWFRAYNGEYADVATLRADGNMRLS
jgi:hypothetical protein